MKRRFKTHFNRLFTAYKANMIRFVEEFGAAYNAGLTPRAMYNTLKVFALCLVRVSCSGPHFGAGRKFTQFANKPCRLG